jgi:GNAT superfamily N-acetyltransferase
VALVVTPARSLRDRREFIELPFRLHANAAQWIPPLRIERHAFLSRRLNPYFKNGEAELFLARRDGRVVGRISAQVDRYFNEYQGNEWGMFGFFEAEDDAAVAAALLDAAAAWLRARGRDRMVGPMDFSINDEAGLLIEGYDREPFVRQPWHPPYYRRLLEGHGMEKAIDLWMWELYIEGRDAIVPGIVEMAARLEPDHGIRIRHMTRRRLRRDLDLFAETYNEAWKDNWGFRPYTKADLDTYAIDLQIVFDSNWFMIAEKVDSGETVGIAITVPDINQVLKRMKGRLLPFGWWHYLRRRKLIDRVRVGFLGVKPEYQHTGVAAGLYIEHFDKAEVTPQKWGEMGWILETNEAMNRGMEGMGGKIAKKYRVYEQQL